MTKQGTFKLLYLKVDVILHLLYKMDHFTANDVTLMKYGAKFYKITVFKNTLLLSS